MAEKKKAAKKTVKKEDKKTVRAKKTKKTEKKTVAKKASAKKTPSKKTIEKEEKKYYEAVGRRKQSVARVRLFTCQPFEGEEGKIEVNGKKYTEFFTTFDLKEVVSSPLKKMKSLNRFKASVKVKGGGIKGQADATRHGLSRALVKFNPDFSKKLKRAGFLTRDPRKKERKKPGLKKARRAPQWRKR